MDFYFTQFLSNNWVKNGKNAAGNIVAKYRHNVLIMTICEEIASLPISFYKSFYHSAVAFCKDGTLFKFSSDRLNR